MQGFLRLFPLNCVIFPQEEINLHIFEPRYLQLIQECELDSTDFGIPFFHSGLRSFGSRVYLKSIRDKYKDGKMDVTVVGIDPFEILRFDSKVKGKLYSGGVVKTRSIDYDVDEIQKKSLIKRLEVFFELLQIRPKGMFGNTDSLSFQIGHKVGLSLEQELELLLIPSEVDRQEFLSFHLNKMIESMEQAQSARKRIQLNGFFQSFEPLDF